jgi:hypothetical protein
MVCAHVALAVVSRADVNNTFGVAVACQISLRTGTSGAELDPHLRAPKATQQAFPAGIGGYNVIPPIGLVTVAFGIFGRDR